MKDLAEIFRDFDIKEEFDFSSETIDSLPEEVSCSDLFLEKSTHTYHEYADFECKQIYFFAQKKTLKSIALAIFSTLFHKNESLKINLTSSSSQVPSFTIYNSSLNEPGLGLVMKPTFFKYCVDEKEIGKFPFSFQDILKDNLPIFNIITDDQAPKDESLLLCGNPYGIALFAELLLNLSQENNKTLEVALEVEDGGFTGVGPFSHELTLWLPGSFNYPVE